METPSIENKEVKKEHYNFVRKFKKNSGITGRATCPYCSRTSEWPKPKKDGDIWTSFCTCIHCNHFIFKKASMYRVRLYKPDKMDKKNV